LASFTGLQIARHTTLGPPWANGFHEHALRAETAIEDVIHYVEYNPVKAALVAAANEWPWSSATSR